MPRQGEGAGSIYVKSKPGRSFRIKHAALLPPALTPLCSMDSFRQALYRSEPQGEKPPGLGQEKMPATTFGQSFSGNRSLKPGLAKVVEIMAPLRPV